jgi:hypothetical protein
MVARLKLLLVCTSLVAAGLTPYLYVLRGLVTPVAYFAPTEVHRLSPGEVWYVLQGNASGETGGGTVVRQLFANRALLAERTKWLRKHVAGQFGAGQGTHADPVGAGSPTGARQPGSGASLALAGAAGLALVAARRPVWTATAAMGAAGAAIFAMAYGKYPDGDRYLLPLETLLALGVGAAAAAGAAGLQRLLPEGGGARVVGAVIGLAMGSYWALSLGVLAGTTTFTRGGYVHHTLHNLAGVEPRAIACSWWASAWGWWYAQYVDGHRPDVTVIAKGPDDCLRDVVPREFGKRPVYLPALTDAARNSEFVFAPSRDLWLVVGRRAPPAEGPDERQEGSNSRW